MNPDPFQRLCEAASFSARAHRHHLRKDGRTPYAAHPFRVCLTLTQIFGVNDPDVLAAALLHDTIEDTPTDFDDLAERFGTEVAQWVGALTKDMRLEDGPREIDYMKVLAEAGWQVKLCKFADIYDNLCDGRTLSSRGKERRIKKSQAYLDAMNSNLSDQAAKAFAIVQAKLHQVAAEE